MKYLEDLGHGHFRVSWATAQKLGFKRGKDIPITPELIALVNKDKKRYKDIVDAYFISSTVHNGKLVPCVREYADTNSNFKSW